MRLALAGATSVIELFGDLAGGRQTKTNILCGSSSEQLKDLFILLGFGSFLTVVRILGKSLPHPIGVLSMLLNPLKCHVMHQQNMYLNTRIGNHWTSAREVTNQQSATLCPDPWRPKMDNIAICRHMESGPDYVQ